MRWRPRRHPGLPVRAMVVELNEPADRALRASAAAQEMSQVSIVNRAVQVYDILRRHEDVGDRLVIERPDGTRARITFT